MSLINYLKEKFDPEQERIYKILSENDVLSSFDMITVSYT